MYNIWILKKITNFYHFLDFHQSAFWFIFWKSKWTCYHICKTWITNHSNCKCRMNIQFKDFLAKIFSIIINTSFTVILFVVKEYIVLNNIKHLFWKMFEKRSRKNAFWTISSCRMINSKKKFGSGLFLMDIIVVQGIFKKKLVRNVRLDGLVWRYC